MNSGRYSIVVLTCFGTIGCASTNIPSLPESATTGTHALRLYDDEQRLWELAAELDKQIDAGGLLYPDPDLHIYLQGRR